MPITPPKREPVSAAQSPLPSSTHSGRDHAHPLDGIDLRGRVAKVLEDHLDSQRDTLLEVGEPVLALIDEIGALLAGGKRLRAAFVYWGYRAFEGPDTPALLRAACAMEIFQAAALLHDDVMDNSDLRRGRPTAHRAFAATHQNAAWEGSSSEFGHSAATLAGDMCLNWSDEIFAGSGLPADQLARARPIFDTMRTQLMAGQYLDVLTSTQDWNHLTHEQRLDQCRRVIRFKSAKYSIEHPLLIGANAVGASPQALETLSAYGLALGEAFQLRDDLLGVFGNPDTTGKPAGDDLREGKRTVLIAFALHLGNDADQATITAALGNADLSEAGVHESRQALINSGAVDRVESMIAERSNDAAHALEETPGISNEGRDALSALIGISTARLA